MLSRRACVAYNCRFVGVGWKSGFLVTAWLRMSAGEVNLKRSDDTVSVSASLLVCVEAQITQL